MRSRRRRDRLSVCIAFASTLVGCSTTYTYVEATDTRSADASVRDSIVPDVVAEDGSGCVVCGSECVDLLSDPAHCGGCDLPCPPGLLCDNGVCVKKNCPKGTVSCPDGTCDDLLVDPDHCGDCFTRCGVDVRGVAKLCQDALCAPDCSKLTTCAGFPDCVDVTTDNQNCGSCFHTCATGKKCAKGSCIDCADPSVICNGACVDTRTDSANCGSCGAACPAGQSCSASHCGCPRGFTDCSGTCKDLQNDATSCKTCGHACATGEQCNAGTCASSCSAGRTPCGSVCVDTSSDVSSCGTCGKTCSGATAYCVSGSCNAKPKCNSGPFNVLFYGEIGALEEPYLPTGATVTRSTTATWSKMSRFDFGAYDLIVIGEGGFGTKSAWDDAFANRVTWSAAITGRIVVGTLDPAHHPSNPNAIGFLKNTLAWAASGPGTGLYVAPDYGLRKLDFLSSFGTWDEDGQEDTTGYAGDDVHIVAASHALMTAQTDASLSKWGLSFHAGLTKTPAGFLSVAQGTAAAGDAGTPTVTTVVAAKDVVCVP